MAEMNLDRVRAELIAHPRNWLVTGCAGFIGSHLVETLLSMGQHVVGLDNFATGSRDNLKDIERAVGPDAWSRFRFIEGDIRSPADCAAACTGIDHVLHQAALGSVPRSIAQPLDTHVTNVDGFLNILVASRDADCKSVVYASSSAVYGDHPELPKTEPNIGRPLSPYAASKRTDEVYADAFVAAYGMQLVGLRYFNVFGPRQTPNGPYAAVIPKWLDTLAAGDTPFINGDGETSRDFCPVANVVQANILSALAPAEARGAALNVALGGRTTLNVLFERLRDGIAALGAPCSEIEPEYRDFRAGDVRHSHADISLARELIGYAPDVSFDEGIEITTQWYWQNRTA